MPTLHFMLGKFHVCGKSAALQIFSCSLLLLDGRKIRSESPEVTPRSERTPQIGTILGMAADLIVIRSALAQDVCQDRISQASREPSKVIEYALASQVDVVDGGDRFELRHKLEPVIFTGTISCSHPGAGSVISGQVEVPGQGFYRILIGFACTISVYGLAVSIWDLVFGTHFLLTRSRTELGPGHPATLDQHWSVFVLIPLVAIPIVAMLWPKARGPSSDARQSITDCLRKLFGELA